MDYKNSNEVTLKIKGSLNDFITSLKTRGYKMTEEFYLHDIFMIREDIDTQKLSSREILAKALIIREVGVGSTVRDRVITFKKKEFDEDGNILNQSSINLKIENPETAEKLLNAIGYKRIMVIKEDDYVYKKDGCVGMAIKDIKGEEPLIEIETEDMEGFRTVEEIMKWVKEEHLPVYEDNFFVKKAEIALDRVLNKNR